MAFHENKTSKQETNEKNKEKKDSGLQMQLEGSTNLWIFLLGQQMLLCLAGSSLRQELSFVNISHWTL